jgi:HD superfamily phosphohydrolase
VLRRVITPRVIEFEAEGVDLLADPIYNFVRFTIPTRLNPKEVTERVLINSPWLQRLREIYQLQTVRWVYPGGEHSRFQHVLGAMHLGGRFASRIYDSLKKTQPGVPSKPYVEELLRLTGLLHDVGHGPFGHFFDHNFLKPNYDTTHEKIGREIIIRELGNLITKIRRSPSGQISDQETLKPKYIAYLMDKQAKSSGIPKWVQALKPLVTGVYTIDNLDYVSRDSYACGLSTGSLFVDRLIHYSFVSRDGLTLHRNGIAALKMFLAIRAYLYSNVYFHRTVRAFDLHLKEVFEPTLKLMVREHPKNNLRKYLELTDQSLFAQVRSWDRATGEKKKLSREWLQILSRKKKWVMISGTEIPYFEMPGLMTQLTPDQLTARMRKHLPGGTKFVVDIATQDPRPENLTRMGQEQFFVYDPDKSSITQSTLENYFREMPSMVVQCRIYAKDRRHSRVLVKAFEEATQRQPSEVTAI